jgi:hemerythrin-like metal-binding protein
MPFAQWDESLSIGDEQIDGQHRWLFFILNRLAESLGHPDEEQAVICCLVDMERYALTHFAVEEAYMESLDYPGLAEHRILHQGFARKVEEYREGLIAGEISARQVADFLRDWLLRHVQGADMDIHRSLGLG